MRSVGLSDRRIVGWGLSLGFWLSVYPTIRLSAQCPDGSPSPCRSTSHVPVSPPANSLAVLYFDNLSSDSAFAYLADGLTEELIAKLGDVPGLRVRSSFGVRGYRGMPTADRAAVGGALRVAFLVTGSVRPSRDRLRIAVELVRAGTGARVWGRVFERPSADPLGVTAEIARAIAAEVAGTLLPAERAVLARRPTPHPQAYDHLLRGNYYLAQRSARAGVRAIEEYQEAVQGDPTFGTAFGRLALAYEFARKYIWEIGPERSPRCVGRSKSTPTGPLHSAGCPFWRSRTDASGRRSVGPTAR